MQEHLLSEHITNRTCLFISLHDTDLIRFFIGNEDRMFFRPKADMARGLFPSQGQKIWRMQFACLINREGRDTVMPSIAGIQKTAVFDTISSAA